MMLIANDWQADNNPQTATTINRAALRTTVLRCRLQQDWHWQQVEQGCICYHIADHQTSFCWWCCNKAASCKLSLTNATNYLHLHPTAFMLGYHVYTAPRLLHTAVHALLVIVGIVSIFSCLQNIVQVQSKAASCVANASQQLESQGFTCMHWNAVIHAGTP